MSYTEPGQYDIKLKTPIDDHLEIGEQYELTLNKVNQSLGLNVTVSYHLTLQLPSIMNMMYIKLTDTYTITCTFSITKLVKPLCWLHLKTVCKVEFGLKLAFMQRRQ